jgi:hypothetical protein
LSSAAEESRRAALEIVYGANEEHFDLGISADDGSFVKSAIGAAAVFAPAAIAGEDRHRVPKSVGISGGECNPDGDSCDAVHRDWSQIGS